MVFIKSIFNFLSTVIIILACIYGLVFLPILFNYYPHIVTDNTMDVVYPPSSIVYYHNVDIENIVKGDIITYKEGENIKCSRVVDITDNSLTIKDDNSNATKSVLKDNILGKNITIIISFLGAFILLIEKHMKIILPVCGAIILIDIILHLTKSKKRQEKKVLNFYE